MQRQVSTQLQCAHIDNNSSTSVQRGLATVGRFVIRIIPYLWQVEFDTDRVSGVQLKKVLRDCSFQIPLLCCRSCATAMMGSAAAEEMQQQGEHEVIVSGH